MARGYPALAAVNERIALAEAVTTRICHDLAGLLGTLGGALEFASEDIEAASLAAETSATLTARVKLLRAAWGGGAGPLSAADIAALSEGLPGIERLHLTLSALPPVLDEVPARLLLCLLLAAVPALPRGGEVRLEYADAVSLQVTLPGNTWPAPLLRCIEQNAVDLDIFDSPRQLAAPLAWMVATQAGWLLRCNTESIQAEHV